jgi:hypothetical protein
MVPVSWLAPLFGKRQSRAVNFGYNAAHVRPSGSDGAAMPNQKLFDLCRRISAEQDSEKMVSLVDELIKLLNEEQAVIKAKIRNNVGSYLGKID